LSKLRLRHAAIQLRKRLSLNWLPCDALRMSQGTVHAICGEIRAMRRKDAEAANFLPMVLAEFEGWMECGELPKSFEE
jgi:hypothetical protein